MSGPKVVRIVTREELLSAGEAQLARLDVSLGEWKKCASLAGTSAAILEASQQRRDLLERMLRADNFDGFARATSLEITFLEADASNLLEKAAQLRAQEKVRLESGRELARFMLRQIESSSKHRVDLERAAAGELKLTELDGILSRANQSLFQPQTPVADEALRELTDRLSVGVGDKVDNIEAWRARSVASSPPVVALLAHIASLELLGAADKAVQLQTEIHSACASDDVAFRGMRFDSLMISVKKAKDDALALGSIRRQAMLLSAEASQIPEGLAIVESLAAAATAAQEELHTAVVSAHARLTEIRAATASESRRRVVVDGLQQLGYQVHEQLSTATSNGGRLVMHEVSESNYGIEVTAGLGMERMQIRTVALKTERDTSCDIPAEQRWCGHFGELQKRLKSEGSELIVEKALGVGAVPVKSLADVHIGKRGRNETSRPKNQKL